MVCDSMMILLFHSEITNIKVIRMNTILLHPPNHWVKNHSLKLQYSLPRLIDPVSNKHGDIWLRICFCFLFLYFLCFESHKWRSGLHQFNVTNYLLPFEREREKEWGRKSVLSISSKSRSGFCLVFYGDFEYEFLL